jgi:hypothetical protein
MRLLSLCPLDLDGANVFIDKHHRHHGPVVGYKFALGAVYQDAVVGVAIVGRPTPRERQDGVTLELTRLCTDNVERKVVDRKGREHDLGICSFLYAAAARAVHALGYKRFGSYFLKGETGVSAQAAGWRLISEVRGRSWNTPSRPRVDKHPTQDKLLFEAPHA